MARLALPALVALAVLAGCGSSSESSTPTSEGATSAEGSPSRAEFIARADALCAASKAKQAPLRRRVETEARRARAEEEAGGGEVSDATRRELALTLKRILAMAETGLSRVRSLEPPAADAEQLEPIFERTESAFDSSRAYGEALEGHEDARAQALAEKGNAETSETAVLAKRYGFRVCGSRP